MSIRHPWRLLILIVVLVVIVLAVWAAVVAYRADKWLSAAEDDAGSLQSAVSAGDKAGIDQALARLRSDSAGANSATGSPIWSLATHAPVVGDDARGVRVVSQVLDGLSHSGLDELAQAATQLTAVVPHQGGVDLAAVTQLQHPVDTASRSLSAAEIRLSTQDPSHFVQALKDKYRFLQSEIASAAATMRSADTAVRVLPTMLGQDGPQDYLLVMQNNAEIRATGGLPGAVSLVRADQGKLTMVKQVAGNSFGQAPKPVLPLTKVETDMYGDQLGRYFLDANFTPDFARSSDLWRARWEQVEGGHLAGVLSIDPVTLSYLLRATGPISAGGVTLSSDNAVQTLLSDVYATYPDPVAQDAFFRAVAQGVFAKVSGSLDSPQALLKGLAQGAAEHRVYVHSFDPSVQNRLEGTAVAGTFETQATPDPQVNVTVNDSTGAKMSYYLRYNVSANATYCTNGVQGLTGSAEFRSEAPKDAAKTLPPYVTGGGVYGVTPGQQIDSILIFGPVGGSVGKVMMNGKPIDAFTYQQDGRPVAKFYAQLDPGEVVNYSWTMKTGPDQTGPTRLDVTPSVVPGTSSSVVTSACS